jgi:hypothetical protein
LKAQLNQEAIRQRKASEIMFNLSSRDKASPRKRVSVWVEELTIADQAWAIMGSIPARTIVACFNSDDILAIEPPAPFHGLTLEWERALLDDGSPNPHPGAEGHAGISGLWQGRENNRDDKDRRKLLRSKLADKATISRVPVPHDIPEDYIRVAAYFIFEKHRGNEGSEGDHWVAAIRQLRRARVGDHCPAIKAVASTDRAQS